MYKTQSNPAARARSNNLCEFLFNYQTLLVRQLVTALYYSFQRLKQESCDVFQSVYILDLHSGCILIGFCNEKK
jgi:hypothetical protein